MEDEMRKSSVLSDSTILLPAKIGAMVILGTGSLMLGMLPLIIGRCQLKKSETRRAITSVSSASTTTSTLTVNSHSHSSQQGLLTSLLLCFGGGVLLFTTFLHLAPEVRESVEFHQSNGQLPTLGSLSLAELLFCAGFFFVYLVEEAVHAALTDKPESSEDLLYRTVSVRRCNNNNSNRGSLSTPRPNSWKDSSCSEDEKTVSDKCRENSAKLISKLPKNCRRGTSAVFVLSPSMEAAKAEGFDHESLAKPVVVNRTPAKPDNSIRSLLTVLALSFHAIFEGLAVGLEPSFSSVVYLAAAIATHKLVISFCVGMELYVAGASNRTILSYLSVFSMVTPLGIVIGVILGHFRNDSGTLGPTPTILQGMAAGTLLYVVFFEVLAREKANDKSGLLQLAAILVGFMLMLGLQIATAHSHEHGNSNAHHDKNDSDHHTTEGDTHNVLEGAITETYRALASSVAPST